MTKLSRRRAIGVALWAIWATPVLSACVASADLSAPASKADAPPAPDPSPSERESAVPPSPEPSATPEPAPTPTTSPAAPTPSRTVEPTGTPRPRQSPSLDSATASGTLPPPQQRLPASPPSPAIQARRGNHGGGVTIPLRSAVDTASLESWFGHEPLLRWDPEWRSLVPNVAASWTASPDARSYTFRLRPGVRWSDGMPFTSADIAFWYRDILLDDAVTPVKPDWMKVGTQVGKVETPDELTVRFEYPAANGLFPRRLAGLGAGQFWPQSAFARQFHVRYNREQVEKMARDQGQPNWATVFNRAVNQTPELGAARWYHAATPTLAPWVVSASLSEGPRLSGRRNPYYWKVDQDGAQLPYLDEITAVVADTTNAVASLLDREHLDVVLDPVADSRQPGASGYRAVSVCPESPNTCVVAPNLNSPNRVLRGLFRSLDFRVGLSLSLDRTDIARRVSALAGQPSQVAPRPESAFHDPGFSGTYVAHDPTAASAAFSRAGLKRAPDGRLVTGDGTPVSFALEPPAHATVLVEAAKVIAAQWQATGLTVAVRPMDRAARATRFRAAEFDVALSPGEGGIDPVLNPTWYLPHSSATSFAPLWALWQESGGGKGEEPAPPAREQQRLYSEIVATADLEAQRRLMARILAIAREQMWVLGVSLPPATTGLASVALGNFPESLIAPTRDHVEPGSHAPELFFVER